MGRTIHDTMGVAQAAEEADWADPAIPEAIAAEMRQNWRLQQAIRAGERRARRQGALAPPPVDPATVPIIVEHDAPYVFHRVTEEDIREVLRRLPRGSLDGLREVRLGLDDEAPLSDGYVPDPFLGRLRYEALPGMFATEIGGTYAPGTATIRLHAWLCQPGAAGALAPLLRADALGTLSHEAAHHFDFTFRRGRSRWATNQAAKEEGWAERVERQGARAIIVPYLCERYPDEIDGLVRWTERHGGVAMSARELLLPARQAVHRLARSVLGAGDSITSRVTFARELHAVGGNDRARTIVAGVLAERPEEPRALAISACILQCERHGGDESEALCRRALATTPDCGAAWDVLVRGYAIQERWAEAARACEDAIAHTPAGRPPARYILTTGIEAHLRLRNWAAVAADVARLRAYGSAEAAEIAATREVLASCWSEQWELSLAQASRLLAQGHGDPAHWLAAARFESAHRLGRPGDAGGFREAQLRTMEASAFAASWARRIRAHVGAAWGPARPARATATRGGVAAPKR